MPRRGNIVENRPGIRRLIRHPYLIIYRLDEAAHVVKVLRFSHVARNPKSLRLD
jgi:hypothetical protein